MHSTGCLMGCYYRVEQATGQALTDVELAGSVLAELELAEPEVDTSEVEDARWFHASWLARQLSSRGPAAISESLVPCLTHCPDHRLVVAPAHIVCMSCTDAASIQCSDLRHAWKCMQMLGAARAMQSPQRPSPSACLAAMRLPTR